MLEHVVGVDAVAQVDDGADAAVAPGLDLVRPRLVGAHQLVGDPVGVGKSQPQIGVVVPKIVQTGRQPPARGGQVKAGHPGRG